MVDFGGQQGRVRRIVLKPNASLSARDAALFLAGIAVVSLTIALAFLCLGFWMVLPFSGAELTLLGGCLYGVLKRNQVREVITITEQAVQVKRIGRLFEEQQQLPMGWIKVTLKKSPLRGHPSRLSIRSHGREIIIGQFLVESERSALAAELKRVLGWANQPLRFA